MRPSAPAPGRAIFLGGAGVRYQEHAPGPELAPWITAFWRLQCDEATTLRVLPDGCMDLIGDDVVGSLSSALLAQLAPGNEAVGVRFRPGGFTALFGVPADELTDARVPLADVVRPRSLLARARDAAPPDPLVAAALSFPTVATLARETQYSPRHLRRRLLALTGHTPKRLTRIARMQALLEAGRGESWARTAADFGFHDESHMINDIRALAHTTPDAMLRERGEPRRQTARS
jgi:AraC-like DNA-binding protein